TLMHGEARLSAEQQKQLSEWLENEADKTDE
ncbi:MAG: heme-binding domain-containing protein, partial [Chloroflexia bacterium]|nr:heme-binding domain-containing protein [Chloroflexia bacterium]